MADLLKMSESEFDAHLRGLQQRRDTSAIPTLTIDDPALAAAVSAANQVVRAQLPHNYVSPENKALGQRPGVFLNIQRGAPAAVRAQLGFDENQLNQFKYLVERYGADNVDLSDEGRFVIRNQPSDVGGGTEDVLVDPIGVEGGDFAQMAAQVGPIIGGVIGGRLGMLRGTGIKRVLGGLLGGAVGAEAAGAAQDMIVRLTRGNDVDATEIAKRRTQMAAYDMAFGAALAGGGKVALKGAEALLGLGYIPIGQTSTKLAQQALLKRTGVDFKLTPGMEAESPFLMRIESMAAARPGSAGVMDEQMAAMSKSWDELRRVYLGLPRTMSDDELARVLPQADIVGEHGLQRLRGHVEGLEATKASAVEATQQTGTLEAQRLTGVDLASEIPVPPVGAALRGKAIGDFSAFRAEMSPRYEAFLSKPEVSQRVVSGRDLASDVAAIERKYVPAAEKQVPGTLLGPTGQPLTTTKTVPLDRFTPAKVRSAIDELKGLARAKVSVNDLKRIRTSIDDAIAEGLSIPGTDTAALNELRDAVDNNITTALRDIDPALLAEWQQLTTDYATGMQRFNKTGIRDLLVKEGEKGSLGNTDIAERVFGNSASALDNYTAYKEFFGARSSEFANLKAVMRQDALRGGKAIDKLTGYINGGELRNNLNNIRPEIARELFGINEQELHQIGEILKQSSARNLDMVELSNLARSGTFTARGIQGIINAEEALTRAYNNKLIRDAAKGTLDAEAVRPSEFVRHAYQMDPKQLAQVLTAIGDAPELRREIRMVAVEDAMDRIATAAAGRRKFEGSLIDDVLTGGKPGAEGEVQERAWRMLIDDRTVDGLKDLLKIMSTKERIPAGAFGSQLGGQNDLARIALHGEAGAVKQLAARFALAFAYTGPLARSITNLFTKHDHGRVMSALITSEPFLNALVSRFGTDGGMQMLAELRGMVEPVQERELMTQRLLQIDPSKMTEADFEQWLKNRARAKEP